MTADRLSVRSFAAIDLGASSGRVFLAEVARDDTADGSTTARVREVHRFSNGPVLRADALVWDIERLFAETLTGLTAAVAEAGGQLDGIGIDTWGVDYALVDSAYSGELEVKHYRSADPQGPTLAHALVLEKEAYAITGVLSQAINTAYQLRTRLGKTDFDNSDPGGADLGPAHGLGLIAERAGCLLLVPDLWAYLLTGEVAAELTIASTTELVNATTHRWSTTLINGWRLDGVDFPELSLPGSIAGHTTAEITAQIGAIDTVPVFRVASHDTASALAFALPDSGELLISSGSWSLAGLCLSAPVLTEAARLAGFTNEVGVEGSTLLLRNLSGMMLVSECARSWSSRGMTTAGTVELVRQAIEASGSTEHDSTDYDRSNAVPTFDVADPRLLGMADMPTVIAELCVEAGQLAPRGIIGMVLCIIESIAVAYAHSAMTCAEISGAPVTSIRIVGGGSRNELLCRRTAELSGLPVTVGPMEASAFGNLAVQFVAAGLFCTLAEAYEAFRDSEPSADLPPEERSTS